MARPGAVAPSRAQRTPGWFPFMHTRPHLQRVMMGGGGAASSDLDQARRDRRAPVAAAMPLFAVSALTLQERLQPRYVPEAPSQPDDDDAPGPVPCNGRCDLIPPGRG